MVYHQGLNLIERVLIVTSSGEDATLKVIASATDRDAIRHLNPCYLVGEWYPNFNTGSLYLAVFSLTPIYRQKRHKPYRRDNSDFINQSYPS
jgi:hypothetical protein